MRTELSLLQQQLIAAQERLDRQVFRLTRLNHLSDELLDRTRTRSVTAMFADAVVDVLDVPVGAVWLLPPHSAHSDRPVVAVGLDASDDVLAATGALLRAHLEQQPDANARDVTELLAGNPPGRPLADAIACRCAGRDGTTAAVLLAANTPTTAGVVGPMAHDTVETLTLLAQKLSGHLGSAADQRLIDENLARLADSERRFRLLAENSSDFVLLANPDRVIEWVSPSISSVLGWAPEEVVGRRTYEFVHVDQRPELEPLWRRVDEGESVTGRIRALCKDGSTRWLSRTLRPVTDDTGTPLGHVAGFHDVQAEVEAEQALRAAEAEAADARDAAEAASRAKSDFLATVTHELRTPLTTMIGASELLLDSDLAPEQRDLVQHQRDASNMLLALVNDILDISRIEAGKIELEALDVELRPLLAHVVGMFAGAAAEKGLSLSYHVADGTPERFVGDPVRLTQVLVNLVSNSVKFTARGGIDILVAAETVSPLAVTLAFSVRDTGIGVPTEAQERIFDAFSQASTSTFREYGGSGLGLSIAQRLVALMGGRMRIDSAEGRGTTISFTALFSPSLTPLEPLQEGAATEPGAAAGGGAGASVLLVEDNRTNRVLLARMLQAIGCAVTTAVSGVEAVAAVELGDFDLVLMDLAMPEMDGFEATRRIRQLEAARRAERTPVLALTANATRNVVAEATEAGMDAFLSKPIGRRDLADAVARWARVPSAQPSPG